MAERKPLSKKLRFEVFKRDKFTCQYCGRKAPDVVLEADHIHPVAEGGEDEIMNLVTSCVDCNRGKGPRTLDDDSVVERQRRQIEELEERRQQLEMMLQWRDEAQKLDQQVEAVVSDHIKQVSGYAPNERGMVDVRRWLKKYPLDVILQSVRDVFDRHGDRDAEGVVTTESWETAFSKVSTFCQTKVKYGDGPELGDLLYIQGIVRRRVGDRYFNALKGLKALHERGYTIDQINYAARSIDDEQEFDDWIGAWLRPPS